MAWLLRIPSNPRSFSVSVSSNGAASSSGNGGQSGRAGAGPVVVELPLDKIRRPLMRTRANDPAKVKDLMNSIQEIGLQVPIDVLEVDGAYYGITFADSQAVQVVNQSSNLSLWI
ncbi:sulfiredoxin, chloroplastic/mitochondrial isoform X3 [Malania oleifera]|uniref:sulfiredoxin, chloroplastic/mitochondrial isoform X3 n=1 Tax=Malania oleifera TaxID=397392 RepID=UPI0025ADE714|nr:sulfiredoxin, chloroplastic/mitochondrial isoform X3 [Malania oleifera]